MLDEEWNALFTLAIVLGTLCVFLWRPKVYGVVTELVCYPVKSCAGVKLHTALLDETGIKFDRRWAVIDENRQLVSLKTDVRLMRIEPELLIGEDGQAHTLHLRYANKSFRLMVEAQLNTDSFEVIMSRHPRLVQSEGPAVAAFLREVLQRDYQLVRVRESRAPHSDFQASFPTPISLPNCQQFHLVSVSSLSSLSTDLPGSLTGVSMDVFRANIVIDGMEAYDEDTWKDFTINGVKFVAVKPCKRCVLPTLDLISLQFDPSQSLLSTLKTHHSLDGLPMFGITAVKRSTGTISVGDRVRVRSRKAFKYT